MHSKTHYFSFYSKWLSEFTSANNSLVGDLISVRPTHQKPRVCWSPPPSNLFKISFDGSVFKDEGQASLSVMIQDDRGLVIASMA